MTSVKHNGLLIHRNILKERQRNSFPGLVYDVPRRVTKIGNAGSGSNDTLPKAQLWGASTCCGYIQVGIYEWGMEFNWLCAKYFVLYHIYALLNYIFIEHSLCEDPTLGSGQDSKVKRGSVPLGSFYSTREAWQVHKQLQHQVMQDKSHNTCI